jgi:hypothetical protein
MSVDSKDDILNSIDEQDFDKIVKTYDSEAGIDELIEDTGVDRGKLTKREFALLIWQSVSDFMEKHGHGQMKQMIVVNKCIKDLVGMSPIEVSKIASESYTYSSKIDDWLNSHKSLWVKKNECDLFNTR